MLKKNLNKGQIIIDVEKDGHLVVNQSGFDNENIPIILEWALSLVYIQLQKNDKELTRKELVDGLLNTYDSSLKQFKESENKNEPNKD